MFIKNASDPKKQGTIMTPNIDLNAKTNGGSTAFHWACYYGHLAVAEIIMKNNEKLKIDLNAKDNGGRTAFHLACGEGHSEIAEIVLKSATKMRIELNVEDNAGWTPFHFVCLY